MSKKRPPKGPYPHFGTSREPISAKLYTAKELDALLRKHAMKAMKMSAAKESGLNEEGSS